MNYYNSETLLEQQQEIEKLKEQNAALAAQVEVLRSDVEYIKGKLYILKAGVYVRRDTDKAYARCESALSKTPQQHLAEIRAEAVESALDAVGVPCTKFKNHSADFTAGFNFCGAQVKLHADKIRQKKK